MPIEQQRPIQNINNTYTNAIIPKIKIIATLGQHTLRHENKTTKFPGKGRDNTFKTIP